MRACPICKAKNDDCNLTCSECSSKLDGVGPSRTVKKCVIGYLILWIIVPAFFLLRPVFYADQARYCYEELRRIDEEHRAAAEEVAGYTRSKVSDSGGFIEVYSMGVTDRPENGKPSFSQRRGKLKKRYLNAIRHMRPSETRDRYISDLLRRGAAVDTPLGGYRIRKDPLIPGRDIHVTDVEVLTQEDTGEPGTCLDFRIPGHDNVSFGLEISEDILSDIWKYNGAKRCVIRVAPGQKTSHKVVHIRND